MRQVDIHYPPRAPDVEKHHPEGEKYSPYKEKTAMVQLGKTDNSKETREKKQKQERTQTVVR